MEKETNKWVTLNRGEYLVTIGDKFHKVCLIAEDRVTVDDITYTIELKRILDTVYSLVLADSVYKVTIEDLFDPANSERSTKLSSKLNVDVNGLSIQVTVDDQRSLVAQMWLQRKSHASKKSILRAPMPGLISKVVVQAGQLVEQGSVLLILEAMKMENEIRALQKCKVESVLVQPGTTVERNDELLTIIET